MDQISLFKTPILAVAGKRNQTIDLLRFVAAMAVAFFHFNQSIPYIDNWYRNILKIGYLGVAVFFVISGFAIILSAYRSKGATDFAIRRLFRIFPPYYASLVLIVLIVIVFKMDTGVNDTTTIPKTANAFGLTFSLLTTPFSTTPTMNWVYWTLTYEVFFYIIILCCFAMPERLHLLFLLLISLLAFALPVHTNGPLFFLKYWPLFALGISLFYLSHQPRHLLPVLFVVTNILTLIRGFLLKGDLPTFIATILTMILIIISLRHDFKKNLLSKFGDYSYSIYLLHVPVGIYLMGRIKTLVIRQHILYNLTFDIVTFLVVLVISHYSFRYVETPAIRLGKKLSRRILAK